MGAPEFPEIWDLTRGSLRSRSAELLPVAAAFLFLPALVVQRFAGALSLASPPSGEEALPVLLLLGAALALQLIGQIALTGMTLATGAEETVADHLRRGLRLVVPGLAVSIVQSLGVALGIGLLLQPELLPLGLLVIFGPGLYLFVRLSVALAALTDQAGGALTALMRSWELTRGHGLRLYGWYVLLLSGLFLMTAILGLFARATGAVVKLAVGPAEAGWGPGEWLEALVSTAAGAAATAILVVFAAMLYRGLGAARSSAG